MKPIVFLLILTHLFLPARSQNDTLKNKRNLELKLGFGLGIYGSAEKYLSQKISIELVGTSFFGFINTVHVAGKFVLNEKNERLWKIGLAGTFLNINFTERSEQYYGFGVPVEFSKRKLSLGAQPFVLKIDHRITFAPILFSICYRWKI